MVTRLVLAVCLATPACAYEAGTSARLDCDALAGQATLVALKVDLSPFDSVQRGTVYDAYAEWSSATCGLVTVQEAQPSETPNVVSEFKGPSSAAELGWGWLKIPTHITFNPLLERHDMQGELQVHGYARAWSPVCSVSMPFGAPFVRSLTISAVAGRLLGRRARRRRAPQCITTARRTSIMQDNTINRYDGYHAFLGRPDLESFCRFWMPGDSRCQVKQDSVAAK
jgi:hypothetical protein